MAFFAVRGGFRGFLVPPPPGGQNPEKRAKTRFSEGHFGCPVDLRSSPRPEILLDEDPEQAERGLRNSSGPETDDAILCILQRRTDTSLPTAVGQGNRHLPSETRSTSSLALLSREVPPPTSGLVSSERYRSGSTGPIVQNLNRVCRKFLDSRDGPQSLSACEGWGWVEDPPGCTLK